MLRTLLTIILGTTAIAVPAAQNDDREARTITRKLQGRVAGPPQSCITASRTRGSIHSGNTVLIEGVNGTPYVSHFRAGCSIPSDAGLILRTTSSQLCSGEIVEGRDFVSGMYQGSCSYGEFVPYRKPRR